MSAAKPNPIKAQLLELKERSAVFIEGIKAAPTDREKVFSNLRAFILCRFALAEENPAGENVADLAQLSLDKLVKIDRAGALQDLSDNCTGASSTIMKKALLITSLQKKLGVTFGEQENDTISQLADAVVRELGSANG